MEQTISELSNFTDTMSASIPLSESVLNNSTFSSTITSITSHPLTLQCVNIFWSFIALISSFFGSVANHGRDFFSAIPEQLSTFGTICSNAFNNVCMSYQSLPDDIRYLINVGAIVYVIIMTCSLLVRYYKKSIGQIDYKSKIGIGFIVYNVIQFFTTTILSCRLLFNIGYGLYYGILDGSVIGYQFFVLVLASLFMYIPRGNLPNILEFIVEHTMIPCSILYYASWSSINLAFILSDTLAILLSPFFGPRAFYLTVIASVVNALSGAYGYIYLSNSVSLIVMIHSISTLLICMYALSRVKSQEKQLLEQNRDDYKRKMGDYLRSIKGDKQKEKELKKALAALAAKGVVLPNLDDGMIPGQVATQVATQGGAQVTGTSQHISKKKLKQQRRLKKF